MEKTSEAEDSTARILGRAVRSNQSILPGLKTLCRPFPAIQRCRLIRRLDGDPRRHTGPSSNGLNRTKRRTIPSHRISGSATFHPELTIRQHTSIHERAGFHRLPSIGIRFTKRNERLFHDHHPSSLARIDIRPNGSAELSRTSAPRFHFTRRSGIEPYSR